MKIVARTLLCIGSILFITPSVASGALTMECSNSQGGVLNDGNHSGTITKAIVRKDWKESWPGSWYEFKKKMIPPHTAFV